MVWDRLQEWALREVGELRRAPVAWMVILGVGAAVGWSLAGAFFAERLAVREERIAVLELQLRTAAGRSAAPSQVASRPSTNSTASWLLASTAIVGFGGALAWIRRLRGQRRRLAGQIGVLDAELASLGSAVDTLVDERDAAVAALKDNREEYALETLDRYSKMRINEKQPRATIRYCSYAGDYELAMKAKGLFTQYVRWPVDVDGSNVPPLPPAEDFKIIFDVGMTGMAFDDLVHGISEGNLLGVPVGRRRFVDREDSEHLIVLVLPTPRDQGAETCTSA